MWAALADVSDLTAAPGPLGASPPWQGGGAGLLTARLLRGSFASQSGRGELVRCSRCFLDTRADPAVRFLLAYFLSYSFLLLCDGINIDISLDLQNDGP